MSTEHQDSRLTGEQRQPLKNRIHDIAPLLAFDEPFTVRDVDSDARSVILLLKRNSAVKCLGKTKVTREYEHSDKPKVDYVNQWRWVPGPKAWLQRYYDDLKTFPCGHRAHICNPREVDGFSCRECLDDGDAPEYDREKLESLGVV